MISIKISPKLSRHGFCDALPERVKCLAIRALIGNPWRREDYEHKCLFLHIPRTGGTSICDILYGKQKGHASLEHFFAWDRCSTESFYKFAIVRNPWDRLVSAFYQLAIKQGGVAPRTQAYWDSLEIRSFPMLVEAMSNERLSKKLWRIPHLRPQSYYVRSSLVQCDFIGRFESYSQSINHIKKALGMGLGGEIKHLNQTSKSDYRTYYNDSQIKTVGEFYEKDIMNFGYYFDGSTL